MALILLLLSGLFNVSDASQLTVRLVNRRKQRINPEHGLAIRQGAGGNGARTGAVSDAGIGVHCAGT